MLVHEPSQKLLSLLVHDAAGIKPFSSDHLHPILAYLLNYSTAGMLSLKCSMSLKSKAKAQ